MVKYFNRIAFSLFTLTILSFLPRCSTVDKRTSQIYGNQESRYFCSYNFHLLQGIDELFQEELELPYVEIEEENEDKKVVVFRASEKMMERREYLKKGDIWVYERFRSEGDLVSKDYIIHSANGKIAKLTYSKFFDQEDYSLTGVRFEENKFKRISYQFSFEDKISHDPLTPFSSIPINLAISKMEGEIKVLKNILKYTLVKQHIKSGEIEYTSTKCYYLADKYSFFWWSYIGHQYLKVDCNNYDFE